MSTPDERYQELLDALNRLELDYGAQAGELEAVKLELERRDQQLIEQIGRAANLRDSVVRMRTKYKAQRSKIADLEATIAQLELLQREYWLQSEARQEGMMMAYGEVVGILLDRSQPDVLPLAPSVQTTENGQWSFWDTTTSE